MKTNVSMLYLIKFGELNNIVVASTSWFSWYLYLMVTQNTLRTREEKLENILQGISIQTNVSNWSNYRFHSCAPIYELPSNISTMMDSELVTNQHKALNSDSDSYFWSLRFLYLIFFSIKIWTNWLSTMFTKGTWNGPCGSYTKWSNYLYGFKALISNKSSNLDDSKI